MPDHYSIVALEIESISAIIELVTACRGQAAHTHFEARELHGRAA
jgi:hypothetical protein